MDVQMFESGVETEDPNFVNGLTLTMLMVLTKMAGGRISVPIDKFIESMENRHLRLKFHGEPDRFVLTTELAS